MRRLLLETGGRHYAAQVENIPVNRHPFHAVGPSEEARLTLEAEKAITQYMLRFLIPRVVIFSAVSGLVGFFIKNVATKTAES